ncbi:MAG: XdhC family protein [Colwellia sp.]|nr:XdhC family protein [Colwellia sp.]
MSTSNHLSHLLAKWYPNRDKFDWVLATIYDTQGPCYRKSGAMMLFSSQGDQLGMLSGGCLESDIGTNARKVMQTGQSIALCYDGSDEDDLSFHLGIGCGGTVYIMLQSINVQNDYLSLTQVYDALKQRTSGYYYQPIVVQKSVEQKSANQRNVDEKAKGNNTAIQAYFETDDISDLAETATIIKRSQNKINDGVNNNDKWLVSPIVPEPHLLIIGGGIDARPLVNMAQQLGWQVSLWDPRPANARKEFFANVNHIIKGEAEILTAFALEKDVNAAVLMSHNVVIDAQALQALSTGKLQYLALLGPEHRRQQVIAQAKVQENALPFKFAGPSGLDIGGTLPESIALSILSECHASLFGKNAHSMSQVL